MKPFWISIKPGTPIPTPAKRRSPASERSATIASTISAITASRPVEKSARPAILRIICPSARNSGSAQIGAAEIDTDGIITLCRRSNDNRADFTDARADARENHRRRNLHCVVCVPYNAENEVPRIVVKYGLRGCMDIVGNRKFVELPGVRTTSCLLTGANRTRSEAARSGGRDGRRHRGIGRYFPRCF